MQVCGRCGQLNGFHKRWCLEMIDLKKQVDQLAERVVELLKWKDAELVREDDARRARGRANADGS